MSLIIVAPGETDVGFKQARELNRLAVGQFGHTFAQIVHYRLSWQAMEPSPGIYRFDKLDKLIGWANTYGALVSVMVMIKGFIKKNTPENYRPSCPPDIDCGWKDIYESGGMGGGMANDTFMFATQGANDYTVYPAKLYVEHVACRFKALLSAMRTHVGLESPLAFVCSSESSFGKVSGPATEPNPYPGREAYGEAWIDVCCHGAKKFAGTRTAYMSAHNWFQPFGIAMKDVMNQVSSQTRACGVGAYCVDLHMPGQEGMWGPLYAAGQLQPKNRFVCMVSGESRGDAGACPGALLDAANHLGVGMLGLQVRPGDYAIDDWWQALKDPARNKHSYVLPRW